jgi:drug/metabolite transporter (DMT)-like permease
VFAAIVCTILFSVSVISGHRSSRLLGGTEANFWRVAVASLVLSLWAMTFGQGFSGSGLPLFLASGVVGIGLGDVALFQALPRLGPRLSSLLVQCLTAPFAALIEWAWLGTTLSLAQILCGLVILAGVAVALAPAEHMHLKRRELLLGLLFAVISALGGAGGAVLSRKAYEVIHAGHLHIDPFTAGFQRVGGGLLLSALFLLLVKRRSVLRFLAPGDLTVSGELAAPAYNQPRTSRWRSAWPWVLSNGLAGQTVGVSLMQLALETTPSGIVLPIIAMTPILVVPFSVLTGGDRPSLRSVLGGLVAVAGVIGLVLSRVR